MLLVALGLAVLMQASAATEAANLSGRVLEQGTHTPVAGAQITLIFMPQGPAQGTPSTPFPYRPKIATSDENGRFLFADLEPGRYRLNAQKSGFATPITMGGLPPLEVKGGQHIDNVEVSLQRGGVIAGRVVDQMGEPLVDARVTVLRKFPTPPRSARGAVPVLPAQLANRLMPAGSGQTNDLGEFRVHSLSPGEYFVQAATQSFGGPFATGTGSGTMVLPTFFPGVSDQAAAQPVFVTAGQTAGEVVVRMIVARAFQVAGVVVDETGRAVTNALLRLTPEGEAGPPLPMMRPFSQARTDASGAFVLDNVTDGSYTLIAVPPLVTATGPGNTGRGSGGIGAFSSWGGASAGGPAGGAVMTESSNGTTVQYRDDAGTKMPVVVNESSVTGLQIVIRRPSAP